MAGYVTEGSLTLASPDIYITVLISLSSFCGIWGLFMFFNITQQ